MGRMPEFSELPPSTNEHIEELREMVKVVEKFLLKAPRISDFCIMHAMFLGRLQKIFRNKPSALDAWKSFDLASMARDFVVNNSADRDWAIESGYLEESDDAMGQTVELVLNPANFHFDFDTPPPSETDTSNPFDHEPWGREQWEIDEDEFFASRSALSEARRILLDYIALVASDSDGNVEPPIMPEKLDLDWIDDVKLRRVCNNYYKQAYSSERSEAYIACAILLGSLLEGVLSSFAQQRRDEAMNAKSAPRNRKNQSEVEQIDRWDLFTLINVANELGWITKHADRALDVIRWHRNYVHPNQMVADSPNLDKATTKFLVDTVLFCMRDLNDFLKKGTDPE